MNKVEKIAHYRRQLKQAQQLMSASMQNYSIAAQIESEAKSELEVLGASTPARKGKFELPEDIASQLRANLAK